MMFGFGDVEAPMQSTVDVVDDLVSSYLRDLIQKAAANSVEGAPLASQAAGSPRHSDRGARVLDRAQIRGDAAG